MRVLVACEESQEVCKAFRALGHEAYSCDIEPCSGGKPEWHLQVDALELLKLKWDLIIAHPPCTYMTNAGAVRMRVNGKIVPERFEKAMEAKEFFMKFYNADCPKIAIENPTPMKIVGLPPYQQAIQPYQFGHPYSKRTCLWLICKRWLQGHARKLQEISGQKRARSKNEVKNIPGDCPCNGRTMGRYLQWMTLSWLCSAIKRRRSG